MRNRQGPWVTLEQVGADPLQDPLTLCAGDMLRVPVVDSASGEIVSWISYEVKSIREELFDA